MKWLFHHLFGLGVMNDRMGNKRGRPSSLDNRANRVDKTKKSNKAKKPIKIDAEELSIISKNQENVMTCQNPKCCKRNPTQLMENFYLTNNPLMKRYPVCRHCLKKTVNTNDLDAVFKILEEMNICFIKSVWRQAVEKFPKTALGNYIKNLSSLRQYKGLTWADSMFEEIINYEEVIYSDEWSGKYTRSQIQYLDEYIRDLKMDFKITTRNHIDYAKKIAKASLAMDIAFEKMLNNQGTDAQYKAMRETFDALCKSAKFAESQRGANDVSLGCYGVVFDKVEQGIFVPEHQPLDKDIYDTLLEQFANVEKSL